MHTFFRFSPGLILGLLVLALPTMGQDKPPVPAKPPAPPKLQIKTFHLQLCDPDEVMQVLDILLEQEPPPAPDMGSLATFVPLRHLAADSRGGVLVLRGRPQDVALATELISVLELPAGKPLPKTETIRAFTLKHAFPEDVVRIGENLSLPLRVVTLSELKMVIATGPEEALRDWANLVAELDVPNRKVDKNNMKRLGIGGSGGGAV